MAALPLSRERTPTVLTRVTHGDGSARTVRSTATSAPVTRTHASSVAGVGRAARVKPAAPAAERRPSLVLVETKRRRWPALVAGVVWTFIVAGLLATAVFHTQLAERQLEIDRLDRAVAAERDRFDELRYQRAELRSPVRLSEAASALGMSRGRATTFVDVTPEAFARQLATAGPINDDIVQIVMHNDPLDQFRAVKSVTGDAP